MTDRGPPHDGDGTRSDKKKRLGDLETNATVELVYQELRRMAGQMMGRERHGHTLEPTALVNEAFIRLTEHGKSCALDRNHFLATAARCMRNILVDHARARKAAKRGGGQAVITLNEALVGSPDRAIEVLDLNDALEKFARVDARGARVAEMRLFAGMTSSEIATTLELSRRTVDGDWAAARLWLSRHLAEN